MLAESQHRAVGNLESVIIPGARIPQRTFVTEYKETYVMDFLQLKMKSTEDMFHALMQYEDSECVVMACLEQARSAGQYTDVQDWRDDLFFISRQTEPGAYFKFIHRNRSEILNRNLIFPVSPPWSIFAVVLGACSDRASWCVFGQMDADIALLGFKRRPDSTFEEKMYSEFRIRRLADALGDDRFYGVPTSQLSRNWRTILEANYL